MINYDDILSLNFYKKEKFNGSYRGMRYRICKCEAESGDIFEVAAWRGPYIYSVTPDEDKTVKSFPFTEEGRKMAVDWLNEHWTANYN
jgi:hypothetical protein